MLSKNSNFEKISTFISIFAVVIAFASFYYSFKQNSENQFLSKVNTRIQTCTSLSNYHRETLSKMSVPEAKRVTIKDQAISSIAERGSTAADLSRALSLCLVEDTDIVKVKNCVEKANQKPGHYIHDDVSEVKDSSLPEGKDILAC